MTLCVTRRLVGRSRPLLTEGTFGSSTRSGDTGDESEFQIQRRLRKEITPIFVQRAYFHHQNIIHFYIRSAHGMILEALQKSRTLEPSSKIIGELQIPDEIRRIKSGSLKWLFAVWPSTPLPLPGGSDGSITAGSPGSSKPNKGEKSLEKLPKVKSADTKQLHAIVDYLKRNDIAIRRLIKLPWLLSSDPVVLQKAVERVQQLLNLEDFGVAISFANICASKLVEVAGIWKREIPDLCRMHGSDDQGGYKNRIDFLAYRLSCQKEDISDMMAKVNHIMTIPLQKAADLIEVLLEAGVKPETIVSDPWVFVHNLMKMRKRIELLHGRDIHEFKPWVLRTQQKRFEEFVEAAAKEVRLLSGHQDLLGFMQEILNCDKRMAASIFTRVPSIKTISATTLNEKIQFLYSAGFTANQIIETPRILGHNIDTISERLAEVMRFRQPVNNLHILCRTSKDYRAIMRKLQKPLNSSTECEIK